MKPPTDLAIPSDVALLMQKIDYPLDRVPHNCHAVSLAIVKSGILPGARVARGTARGVMGQHSWVVHDGGPYDMDAHVVDATLWSYDPSVTSIWQGTYRDGIHRPHGWGDFMQGDCPVHHGGETIRLVNHDDLPVDARMFLDGLGPLDVGGWMQVAKMPVQGWPSRTIIEAMLDTPVLSALVPIDVEGMLTDRNPGNLYLP